MTARERDDEARAAADAVSEMALAQAGPPSPKSKEWPDLAGKGKGESTGSQSSSNALPSYSNAAIDAVGDSLDTETVVIQPATLLKLDSLVLLRKELVEDVIERKSI